MKTFVVYSVCSLHLLLLQGFSKRKDFLIRVRYFILKRYLVNQYSVNWVELLSGILKTPLLFINKANSMFNYWEHVMLCENLDVVVFILVANDCLILGTKL